MIQTSLINLGVELKKMRKSISSCILDLDAHDIA